MTPFEKAITLFDAYNQQDPKQLLWEGVTYPTEYFYALQLYNWITKLDPAASEVLLLASRSQHIGRWKIPRHSYPDGKASYLKWRADLAKFHADVAGELLKGAGYDEVMVKLVQHILLKEQLKTDPEVQVMENALCLVFLEFQYEDFLKQHEENKVIRIIRRSWSKMSEPGRQAALGLSFSKRGKELIEKALGGV